MREQGRWHMVWPPVLWSVLSPSPFHDFMNFSLEKCLCLVMSSVTGASAVTAIPYPHPPGIVRISASLFPGLDLELTNVCQPILWTSAQVPHQGRNRCYWLSMCTHGASISQGKAIGVKYSVLITEVLLSSFLNRGDIYKILSNILGVPLWIYTWEKQA